jgi:AcrR family transcriptional regulator
MARWQPDAAGRLQAAALELYAENGYDETTVADIAARAGLTERTYFRHFPDKREVLFHGSQQLRDRLVTGVDGAPATAAPLQAVALAIESLAPFFDDHRAHSARRYRVISASSELQERELIKRASLVAAVGDALRRRGTPDAIAELAAEAGLTVFSDAYLRWVTDRQERSYAEHVRRSLAQLREVAGGTAQPSPV